MAYQGNQIDYKNLNDELKLKIDKVEGVESQIQALAPKVDNSWQKGVYNDVSIDNLGAFNATKVFTINQADWKNTGNVEQLGMVIPFRGAFSGVVKVTYSAMWGNAGTWGSTEVIYNIASFPPQGTKLNEFTITTASTEMLRHFKIVSPYIDTTTGNIALLMFRSPTANCPLQITVSIDGTLNSSGYSNMFGIMKDTYIDISDLGSPMAGGYPWAPQQSQIPTYDAIGRWDRKSDSIAFDKVENGVYPDPNTCLDTTF